MGAISRQLARGGRGGTSPKVLSREMTKRNGKRKTSKKRGTIFLLWGGEERKQMEETWEGLQRPCSIIGKRHSHWSVPTYQTYCRGFLHVELFESFTFARPSQSQDKSRCVKWLLPGVISEAGIKRLEGPRGRSRTSMVGNKGGKRRIKRGLG